MPAMVVSFDCKAPPGDEASQVLVLDVDEWCSAPVTSNAALVAAVGGVIAQCFRLRRHAQAPAVAATVIPARAIGRPDDPSSWLLSTWGPSALACRSESVQPINEVSNFLPPELATATAVNDPARAVAPANMSHESQSLEPHRVQFSTAAGTEQRKGFTP